MAKSEKKKCTKGLLVTRDNTRIVESLGWVPCRIGILEVRAVKQPGRDRFAVQGDDTSEMDWDDSKDKRDADGRRLFLDERGRIYHEGELRLVSRKVFNKMPDRSKERI